MIKINICYIAKNDKDSNDALCAQFTSLVRNFNVKLDFLNLFSKSIKEKQKQTTQDAQKSYSEAFLKVFKTNQYNIALSPHGELLDSFKFANLLQNKIEINFFIGGAYGLEEAFLQKCNHQISLSPLTFSHKIAKLILSEQIYRAFCLLNNHPYHK